MAKTLMHPYPQKAQTQTFIVPSSKLLLTMSMASWLDINSHTPSEASTINLSPACSTKTGAISSSKGRAKKRFTEEKKTYL